MKLYQMLVVLSSLALAQIGQFAYYDFNCRALKSDALSVGLTQMNSIFRSNAETIIIISHAFKVPCCLS